MAVWTGARTRSAAETRAAGAEFVARLSPGTVVALHGEIGSGKTTFVEGMARGLGLSEPATSPTFALIHEYGQPPRLVHADCYRETSLERWDLTGIVEYFDAEVITVVEWAEIIAPLLPRTTIHVKFAHVADPTQRNIQVQA